MIKYGTTNMKVNSTKRKTAHIRGIKVNNSRKKEYVIRKGRKHGKD